MQASSNLTLPPHNVEAEHYQQLARATLGLKSVFDCVNLATVQAVCLLASYDVISGRKNSLESAWKIMSFGFSLAVTVSRPFLCFL